MEFNRSDMSPKRTHGSSCCLLCKNFDEHMCFEASKTFMAECPFTLTSPDWAYNRPVLAASSVKFVTVGIIWYYINTSNFEYHASSISFVSDVKPFALHYWILCLLYDQVVWYQEVLSSGAGNGSQRLECRTS